MQLVNRDNFFLRFRLPLEADVKGKMPDFCVSQNNGKFLSLAYVFVTTNKSTKNQCRWSQSTWCSALSGSVVLNVKTETSPHNTNNKPQTNNVTMIFLLGGFSDDEEDITLK